jgi:hypothetical protein
MIMVAMAALSLICRPVDHAAINGHLDHCVAVGGATGRMHSGPIQPLQQRRGLCRRQSHYAILPEAAVASSYREIMGHHFPLPYSLPRLAFSLYLNLGGEGVRPETRLHRVHSSIGEVRWPLCTRTKKLLYLGYRTS